MTRSALLFYRQVLSENDYQWGWHLGSLIKSRAMIGSAKNGLFPSMRAVSKLVKFGDQPVSLGAGIRYWAETPDGGPHGWAARATLTFLFAAK
jgi:hypothetical protein